MSNRFLSAVGSIKTIYAPMNYPLVFLLAFTSCQAYAELTDFGIFSRDITPQSGSVASGSYTTNSGATGRYTISVGASRGYSGRSFTVGDNGIEIRNDANTDVANDRFTYTFAITPNDNTAIHTIKIGQSSYPNGSEARIGNSEVARQKLSYTQNSDINITAQATVRQNPTVPYYYEAMGDYFMGQQINNSDFSYNNSVRFPQLRVDSGTNLYFYRLDFLNGTNLGNNTFRPNTNNSSEVSVRNNEKGFLPLNPTFTNIIKSTSINPNNQNTYQPLTGNIPDGSSYVSYGIKNTESNYVIAVRNARSVTLQYEGIMNGSNAIVGNIVGETFREWISFGVESELANYVFSGYVYNDNGGIANINNSVSNNNYFNGKFDNPNNTNSPASTPPFESAITGSTVKPIDCVTEAPLAYTNVPTTEAGRYEILVPTSSLAGKSQVCLIEERGDSVYPIRTTNAKQEVSLTGNIYLYENINFGRVIEDNKALVLEKEQAVNDCTISTLPPNAQNNLNYSKSPLRDIEPGQCIAYRITATNRANLELNKVVVTDTLQKKDLNNPSGSKVTSFLNLPERTSNPSKAYNDNVNYGENGTVVTSEFDIPKRKKQVFYFNTKYGDSQSNP